LRAKLQKYFFYENSFHDNLRFYHYFFLLPPESS
jgi:hypothetical protein